MKSGLARRLAWLVVAALLGAVFMALGFWQLGRGAEKEAFLSRYQQALRAAPLPWALAESRLLEIGEQALPLRVQAFGYFDPSRQVLHDHRLHEGRAGVHVLSLFRPREGRLRVLVNLGWAPFDRHTLPLPPLPKGAIEIQGLLVAPPAVGWRLEQAAWEPGRVPLLLHLDLTRLSQEMGEPLAPAVLLLDAREPFGLLREWKPLPNTLPPERHRGYALQWFGLAATVWIIALVLLFRRHA